MFERLVPATFDVLPGSNKHHARSNRNIDIAIVQSSRDIVLYQVVLLCYITCNKLVGDILMWASTICLKALLACITIYLVTI